jgi:hypothetical protein
MIATVLAYDDGDADSINYWVNAGQNWLNGNNSGYSVFDTGVYGDVEARLQNIALSSADSAYAFNGNPLDALANLTTYGTYYKYHNWDVTRYINNTIPQTVTYTNTGAGAYASFKNVLSVLTITEDTGLNVINPNVDDIVEPIIDLNEIELKDSTLNNVNSVVLGEVYSVSFLTLDLSEKSEIPNNGDSEAVPDSSAIPTPISSSPKLESIIIDDLSPVDKYSVDSVSNDSQLALLAKENTDELAVEN